MTTTSDGVRANAELLAETMRAGGQRDPLPEASRPTDLASAYALQDLLADVLGEPVTGWKVAATDPAALSHLGIVEPFSGRLFGEPVLSSPAVVDTSSIPGARAAIECEIGLRLVERLDPADAPFSEEVVAGAVGSAAASFELPGMRLRQGDELDLFALVADNAGGYRAICGPELPVGELPALSELAVTVTLNGEQLAEGRGSSAWGGPFASLTWLANHLAQRGLALEAGVFVLTGALTGLHRLQQGDEIAADFGPLGPVRASFK